MTHDLLGIQRSRWAARAPMGGRDRTSGSVSTSSSIAVRNEGMREIRRIGNIRKIRRIRRRDGVVEIRDKKEVRKIKGTEQKIED